jgi:hypothetical protein
LQVKAVPLAVLNPADNTQFRNAGYRIMTERLDKLNRSIGNYWFNMQIYCLPSFSFSEAWAVKPIYSAINDALIQLHAAQQCVIKCQGFLQNANAAAINLWGVSHE